MSNQQLENTHYDYMQFVQHINFTTQLLIWLSMRHFRTVTCLTWFFVVVLGGLSSTGPRWKKWFSLVFHVRFHLELQFDRTGKTNYIKKVPQKKKLYKKSKKQLGLNWENPFIHWLISYFSFFKHSPSKENPSLQLSTSAPLFFPSHLSSLPFPTS